MIEKRFTFHHDVDGIDYIQDKTDGFCFICDKLLCSLLNDLSEENKQLRIQVSKQGTQIDFLKDENQHIRDLVNENEQLKERLKINCPEFVWRDLE